MSFDAELMLRATTAGDLEASENGTVKDFGPDPLQGLTYKVNVPEFGGSGALTAAVYSGSSATGSAGFTQVCQVSGISAAGDYFMRGYTRDRYRQLRLTITGGSYGEVQAGPVPAGQYLSP